MLGVIYLVLCMLIGKELAGLFLLSKKSGYNQIWLTLGSCSWHRRTYNGMGNLYDCMGSKRGRCRQSTDLCECGCHAGGSTDCSDPLLEKIP